MNIREVTDDREIEALLSIAATYSFTADQLPSIRRQLIKELAEVGDNRQIFVGIEDDMAVAMIQIILKRADNDPDLADGRDVAHAHNLWVRCDLQGKGIGKQMMAFIEDTARQLGKKVLTLGVDNINERAVELYDKLGYKVFKTEPGRTPEETGLYMKKIL